MREKRTFRKRTAGRELTTTKWSMRLKPKTSMPKMEKNLCSRLNVCPKWFGKSKLKQSDGVTCLRGANGKPLQEFGKRQIWLKFGGKTKRYDFHVVDVTKPILSVSYLCEHGIETHLAEHPFLRFGDGHEPSIRKGGVYFVKAQTVNVVETMTQDESENSSVRADGLTENSCVPVDGWTENSSVRADGLT